MDGSRNSSDQDKCPLTMQIILRFVYELRFILKCPCELRLSNREMFVLKEQTHKD